MTKKYVGKTLMVVLGLAFSGVAFSAGGWNKGGGEQDEALHLEIRDEIGSYGTILAEVTIRWKKIGPGYSNGQIVVDLADDGLTVENPQFEVTMPGVVRMQLVGNIAKAVKAAEVCRDDDL